MVNAVRHPRVIQTRMHVNAVQNWCQMYAALWLRRALRLIHKRVQATVTLPAAHLRGRYAQGSCSFFGLGLILWPA
jgi:hypothetical protein